MASQTRYKKGDWKAVCDSCGQRFLASKLRKRWDGLMVCSKDFEQRQPQDFVRARVDTQAVPYTRPESTTYIFKHNQGAWDTVLTPDTVSVLITFLRSFTDIPLATDSLGWNTIKSLADTTVNTDVASITVSQGLTDTSTVISSGSVLLFDYIDVTYFAADYVGTTTTF